MKINEKNYDKLYIFLILILFAGIFFSYILISISQFLLLGIWLLEGDLKNRLKRLWQDKPAIIFLSLFWIFVISGIWSQDKISYLNDLKLKLPLFSIPFLLLSKKKPFSEKQIKFLLASFVAVNIAKSLQSWTVFIIKGKDINLDDFCQGLSHIRYAIYTLFSIFVTYYFLIKTQQKYIKLLSIALIAYFLVLLIILQSLTAIVVFIILASGLIIFYILNSKKIYTKIVAIAGSLAVLLFISLYLYNQISLFYKIKDPAYQDLPQKTANNNPYVHNLNNKVIENGHYVGYYICEKELKKEWNKRSNFDFSGFDKLHQPIKSTILRYMTSKGLTKDSVGIWALTDDDIKNIENGYTNYRFTDKFDINARIYKVIWQFYIYKQTGYANNQSISQRIEAFKTSVHLLKKHLLYGVGTGDYKKALMKQYEIDKSKLPVKQRKLPHNQYISIIISLGILLGGLVIVIFFYPFFKNKKYKNFLPTIFFTIIVLSMFSDDTLIRASSVNFTAIFYTLLILQKNKTNDY